MFRRDYLKWWLRPSFLRPWGRRGETLFAGPFLGEFGWELMCWQGFVRKLSRAYPKTIVYASQGREAIYADFATEIISHNFRGTAECDYAREPAVMAEALGAARKLLPPGADHLLPLGYQPLRRQEFFAYGRRMPEAEVDILFHARGRNFGVDRNWDRAKWNALAELLHASGYKLGCIGVRGATVDVDGPIADFRDAPLGQTLDRIASARLVVGPSSGPMHLASLCRTPHLVWTDSGRYARGHTNRYKYESWWNPFGTKALVLDEHGFDPPVEAVTAAVDKFFSQAAPLRRADARQGGT
jgi:ADP-heptose:LPS heptosyltransferase